MIWQQTFIFLAQQPPRPASAGGPSILGSSSRTPSLEPAGRAASASRLLPRFLLAANLWICPSWWCGWGWGLKVLRRAGWHRWDALFVKWLVEQVVVQLGKPSKSSPNFHFCMYPAHSVIIQSLVSWIKATQQQIFGLTISYFSLTYCIQKLNWSTASLSLRFLWRSYNLLDSCNIKSGGLCWRAGRSMKIPEVAKINGRQTYSPANKIQLDSGTRQYFQDDDDCT